MDLVVVMLKVETLTEMWTKIIWSMKHFVKGNKVNQFHVSAITSCAIGSFNSWFVLFTFDECNQLNVHTFLILSLSLMSITKKYWLFNRKIWIFEIG